jgi:hypothetical protein
VARLNRKTKRHSKKCDMLEKTLEMFLNRDVLTNIKWDYKCINKKRPMPFQKEWQVKSVKSDRRLSTNVFIRESM